MNMRKLIIILSIAVFFGCQKQEPDEIFLPEQLSASLENFKQESRTAMNPDRQVVWSKDDCVVFFCGNDIAVKYQVTDASAGQSKGVFSLVENNGDDSSSSIEIPHTIAFYPYSEELSISASVNGAYDIAGVVLPPTQAYAEDSFANQMFLMTAITESKTDQNPYLDFRNVLGAMKLQIKGNLIIKSIMVEGSGAEKLSGAATVTVYSDRTIPNIRMSAEASTSVTLDCGDGVLLSETDITSFIIALPPVVFENGFTVTVTDAAEKTHTFSANVANTVLRSSILVMPEIILTDDIEGGYVDEYGICHGPGVNIDGLVWAPVNCGYHKTYYKWGKLYQWGRIYGQGYSGYMYDANGNQIGETADAILPELVEGGVSLDGDNSSNADVFYFGPSDWLTPRNDKLWNSDSDSSPVRTQYDPCPDGWRVPTYSELITLSRNRSSWTTDDTGMQGYWFSGTSKYSESAPQIFLPAAGYRGYVSGATDNRGLNGYYWSSKPYTRATYGAGALSFGSGTASMHYYGRAGGYSVRCVQE